MDTGVWEVEEAVHVYHCGERAASASVLMGLAHITTKGQSLPGLSALTPFRIKLIEERQLVR